LKEKKIHSDQEIAATRLEFHYGEGQTPLTLAAETTGYLGDIHASHG
jgi:hypothetical protein